MTPIEARKLWVEALRSGEYEQGKGRLNSGVGRFCCLGVACDLYQKHVGDLSVDFTGSGFVRYEGNASSLPDKVTRWLGITSHGALAKEYGGLSTLVAMNDMGGCSFDTIADEIERGNLIVCPFILNTAQTDETISSTTMGPLYETDSATVVEESTS